MIHISCQILVFRITAWIIVGSPPNQSKKMTEMLKQKYEIIEGIVYTTLDISALSWRSQWDPFQLVYSFLLLLSLLSFPLKLSAASLLLLLCFPLSPFTPHLTSFIHSILAVASSTSSCQGTKSHRDEYLSAWALLSREVPTQHVLQQQFPQKAVPVWFTTLSQQLLKWHNWGDTAGWEEWEQKRWPETASWSTWSHCEKFSCNLIMFPCNQVEKFAQNRYNFQTIVQDNGQGWLYRYLAVRDLPMLSTGKAKHIPTTRRYSLTSVKACSEAWRW